MLPQNPAIVKRGKYLRVPIYNMTTSNSKPRTPLFSPIYPLSTMSYMPYISHLSDPAYMCALTELLPGLTQVITNLCYTWARVHIRFWNARGCGIFTWRVPILTQSLPNGTVKRTNPCDDSYITNRLEVERQNLMALTQTYGIERTSTNRAESLGHYQWRTGQQLGRPVSHPGAIWSSVTGSALRKHGPPAPGKRKAAKLRRAGANGGVSPTLPLVSRAPLTSAPRRTAADHGLKVLATGDGI